MTTHRDRAWRRRQRARVIKNRIDRAPEYDPPARVHVWQLHTEDDQPLNIFHQTTRPGSTQDVVVEVKRISYSWGSYLQPSWGGRAYHDRPTVIKKVREYDPGFRQFAPGKLSKTACPEDSPTRSGKDKPRGAQKKWRNGCMNHSGKVYRASKLGFTYPRWKDTALDEE